jgi:hypothetical protein
LKHVSILVPKSAVTDAFLNEIKRTDLIFIPVLSGDLKAALEKRVCLTKKMFDALAGGGRISPNVSEKSVKQIIFYNLPHVFFF